MIRKIALAAFVSLLLGGCALSHPIVYGPNPPAGVAPPIFDAPPPVIQAWVYDPYYGHCCIDEYGDLWRSNGILWHSDGDHWVRVAPEYNHWRRDMRHGWYYESGYQHRGYHGK